MNSMDGGSPLLGPVGSAAAAASLMLCVAFVVPSLSDTDNDGDTYVQALDTRQTLELDLDGNHASCHGQTERSSRTVVLVG
jgi:hypothetical protein